MNGIGVHGLPGKWREEVERGTGHLNNESDRAMLSLADELEAALRQSGDASVNARLIAAAPDLLEACMLARHICEDGNALQRQLDAAIAKATGHE